MDPAPETEASAEWAEPQLWAPCKGVEGAQNAPGHAAPGRRVPPVGGGAQPSERLFSSGYANCVHFYD